MLDTVSLVGEESERRRRTVPIHDWWADAVRREMPKQSPPLNQKLLAKKIGAAESEVSRALRPTDHEQHKPVLEIVMAISDELKLPYPIIVPETEEIALHLATQHRLVRRDVKIGEIKPGVARSTKESQTRSVVSEHGSRPRQSKKDATRTRAARHPS